MLFLGRARFFKRRAFVDGACQAINCRAIGGDHSEYVFGRFHAAFDFQAVDARFRELGKHVDGAKVFRGQQAIARRRKFCVGVLVAKGVGKAACLRAGASVRRAPANHGAHKALSRIANAQGAVREALGFHIQAMRFFGDLGELSAAQLARQRYAFGAEFRRRSHAVNVMRVHLRRDMQARIGQRAPHFGGEPDILHDKGVYAASPCLAGKLERRRYFVGHNRDVEREVHANPAQVGEIARARQVVKGEVVCAATGIERIATQVHRIGSGRHRGMQTRHRACGGEKFHMPVWVHHVKSPIVFV